MQPRLRFALVLSALVLALAIGAGAEDSYARIVRLSYVNGEVQLDRDGTSGLDTAFLNMPVANGAQLVTGNDGFAEAEFEAGTTVRLAPNGDLRFRELGLQDGYKVSTLELVDGTAYFNVKHQSHDQFHLLLNGQELLVPKSSRFRVVMRPQGAEISVFNGELSLLGDQETKIKKNETLSLDFQQPGRFSLSGNIETLAYDAWDQEREGYSGRFVSSGSYLGYSSGFSYGWNDLNYFGSFLDVAGYGSCWRPYGFDQSWDPYMDGAWVYYPGWGYTWVSGYPWGWAPYRYGRWIWIGGYGWVWQPGHHWNRWYAYSPIYNAPHDYHGPRPPRHPPVYVGGGTGGGRPHPGGPAAGGPTTGGGHGSGVVVVGHGPYTGGGGGGVIGGRTGSGVTIGGGGTVGTGSGRPLPSAITPGMLPNRDVVIEQLRRVHGEDLGVRGNGRVIIQGSSTGGSPAAGTQGQGAATGATGSSGTQTQVGAGATVGTTVGTPGPKQQPVVIMPPSPQPHGGAGAGNIHEQIQVQPQSQPHPNPPAIVMPPQPAHPTPPPSTPPPSSPQTSGGSGGGGRWGGGSSSGGSSGGSHGGYSGGGSTYSSGSSSGSSGGSSGGSHSSGSTGSSGGHSNSSGSHSSGSHSSGSSEPK